MTGLDGVWRLTIRKRHGLWRAYVWRQYIGDDGAFYPPEMPESARPCCIAVTHARAAAAGQAELQMRTMVG